jgi:thiol-disulfide isomerase/thioredoxin
MYRKSFFIVAFALLLVGILFTGTRMVAAIPGITGYPSSYDPKTTLQDATNTSKTPVLVEFYTDQCGTCKIVTPWVHKLATEKYKNQVTLVMINLDDPQQSQYGNAFGVTYVPTIYVFDPHTMAKAQVDPNRYGSIQEVDSGISRAINQVQKSTTSSLPAR